MRKLTVFLIAAVLFVSVGCGGNITSDEKTAKRFVKSQGYDITDCKGEIYRYTLEKNLLVQEGSAAIPYQQMWGVQTVDPEAYFGKEITIYCFTVSNHPLEALNTTYKSTNVYIMLAENQVIGGYSYPNTDEFLVGGLYSLDGKTLERVTGQSYIQWLKNWNEKYGY